MSDYDESDYDEYVERLRFRAEEYECAQQYLDDVGVPREEWKIDGTKHTYSVVGRIRWLVQTLPYQRPTAPAPATTDRP